MKQRGHEVRVIDFDIGWRNRPGHGLWARRRGLRAPSKVIEGSEIDVVRPSVLMLPVLEYISAFVTHGSEIRRQIREFRPDVILGLGILNASTAIRLARRNGLPFVYYLIDELHQLVPQRGFRGVARAIEQGNVRRASLVLAINQALRDYALSMGAPADKAKVLPAGIDLDRYVAAGDGRAVRKQLGLEDSDLVLFFMGWIYPFSGIREVVESLAGGSGRDAQVKLVLVGKGDTWDELASLVKAHGAEDRIKMVGFRPYSEMPSFLAAASICLLPAQPVPTMRNIVPIKMYEYLAAGKAVIATRLPGLLKEFGEGHGVVYVNGPSEVVSKAIELAQSGALQTLGQRGRSFVANNDWNTITDSFEADLNELICGTRTGR
jgi:glycosyltransferase involved in cell wall biosynthesis